MDRVAHYRTIVCDFLATFAESDPNAQLLFDRERDRYMVLHNEWQNNSRIYGCAMHLDVIDAQVWIQHNSTEIYIDRELIRLGVDARDVILGFRSPGVRKLLATLNSKT